MRSIPFRCQQGTGHRNRHDRCTFLLILDSPQSLILIQFRIPRILLSMMVGAGLAVSGALLQGMIRNRLASPDVIGLTKGAGLAAVIFILLFPKSPPGVLPFAAFAGAHSPGCCLPL
ncbi:iron ABC transporter permease [Paenibacillus cremeus]|uniref:Iron ABC transporter permease n=1 Tax=Paenibacillus cremeus TaxID=2163881 RepID=A0A559JKD3_9BACL|nr:iron ABC transporter permease [Paenibacillus cremeus]